MRKKYNYFDDDDPVVQGKTEKKKSSNFVAFLKYIFVVALFTCKDFFKRLASPQGRAEMYEKASGGRRKSPVIQAVKLIIVFIAVIAVIVSAFFVNIKNENAKELKFNKAAYKVCSKYNNAYGVCNYKSLYDEYNIKGYILTGLCYVREMDFDGDRVSELLVVYNENDSFFAEVWGFHSKKFVKLYKKKLSYSDNFNDDVWFALYADGKKHYIAEHNTKDISKVNILRLHGDSFSGKDSADYDVVTHTYKIQDEDATDNFEQIKVSVLKEYSASLITEEVYNTVDSFSEDKNEENEATTLKKTTGIMDAYWSLIERYNEQYGCATVLSDGSKAYIDGLSGVELIDFDGDGVKELVLIYRKNILTRNEDNNGNMITYEEPEYFCEIYRWNGNHAVMIYQNEGISNKLNSADTRYFITKKSGKERLLCTNHFSVEDYGRTVNATSKVMKLKDDSFVTEKKASYRTRYGYTEYYLDGKYSYKSNFEYNGGFEVPFFDGTDSDIDTAVWSVLYTQLPGSERAKLENQVNLTVQTIKSIHPDYVPNAAAKK